MSNEKKKTNVKRMIMLSVIFLAAVGISFVFGLFLGKMLKSQMEGISLGEYFLWIFAVLACLYASVFFHVVIHEGGHLVFGLFTGYRFSSFRIGSLMWVKKDGKLKLKRHSLTGTGGQCLMEPPELIDGKMPYILYNFGGVIANVVFSCFAVVLAILFKENGIVAVIFSLFAVIGVGCAIMNGIPLRIGGMDNDGHNAVYIGKNPEAMRAFWIQMKIVEKMSSGMRIKDMPEEWFLLPSEEGMQNSMIAAIAVFRCNRFMDACCFAEADELMEKLLKQKNAMAGVHRNILVNERIFCELIGETRKEVIDSFLTDQQKAFMKSMKKTPSVLRTRYAYTLLFENKIEEAAKIKAIFEKVAKTYPYPQELEAEYEMLSLAEEKYQTKSEASSCETN